MKLKRGITLRLSVNGQYWYKPGETDGFALCVEGVCRIYAPLPPGIRKFRFKVCKKWKPGRVTLQKSLDGIIIHGILITDLPGNAYRWLADRIPDGGTRFLDAYWRS